VTTVLTQATLRSATIAAWMAEIGAAVRAQRDQLTQLDAAIGDGDHGTNMVRGFDAVETALAGRGEDAPGQVLIACGKTLVATVGGASGPLWGSALRAAGRSLGDAAEIDAARLAEAGDGDAPCLETAVQVDERSGRELAAQLAFGGEGCEPAVEASVERGHRALESRRICQRNGENVCVDRFRRDGFDVDLHQKAMLADYLRSLQGRGGARSTSGRACR
jgi:hypothetical protein